MHGDRLSARKTVCALPVSVRFHLCQPVEGAGERGTEELGQHQARTDHAAQDFLEVRAGASAAWRPGRPDWLGPDRPSPDHVRTRSVSRPAERVELFAPAARGKRSFRVTTNDNPRAVVPFDDRSEGPYVGAR